MFLTLRKLTLHNVNWFFHLWKFVTLVCRVYQYVYTQQQIILLSFQFQSVYQLLKANEQCKCNYCTPATVAVKGTYADMPSLIPENKYSALWSPCFQEIKCSTFWLEFNVHLKVCSLPRNPIWFIIIILLYARRILIFVILALWCA